VLFCVLGGQEIGHLCDGLGLVEPRRGPEGGGDRDVQAAAAAGLYDEAAEDQVASRSPRADADAKPVSMELARAQTRIAALEELVARQDDELRFLRQLTVDSVGRRAAS